LLDPAVLVRRNSRFRGSAELARCLGFALRLLFDRWIPERDSRGWFTAPSGAPDTWSCAGIGPISTYETRAGTFTLLSV